MLRGALVAACIVCATTCAQANQLVSIEGIALGDDGYVSSFAIDTWAVRVLAVCHIPIGWVMTVGRELDASGHLNGQASGFMLNLEKQRLRQVKDLFLIEDIDVTRKKSPTEPPTFNGYIMAGSYKERDADDRKIALKSSNIVLKPASACPAPSN